MKYLVKTTFLWEHQTFTAPVVFFFGYIYILYIYRLLDLSSQWDKLTDFSLKHSSEKDISFLFLVLSLMFCQCVKLVGSVVNRLNLRIISAAAKVMLYFTGLNTEEKFHLNPSKSIYYSRLCLMIILWMSVTLCKNYRPVNWNDYCYSHDDFLLI